LIAEYEAKKSLNFLNILLFIELIKIFIDELIELHEIFLKAKTTYDRLLKAPSSNIRTQGFFFFFFS